MTKHPNGSFAFIDVENMRNTALEAGYLDFDYEKLFSWLTQKKGISRVYFYVAIESSDTEKRSLFEKLGALPNSFVQIKEVMVYPPKPRYKSIVCPKCKHQHVVEIHQGGKRKGNCDAELTLDVIRFGVRKKYAELIVFSGDGDFAKVYEYVSRDLKKGVTVYAPAGSRTSLQIRKLATQGVITLESANGLLQHNGRK